VRKVTCQGLRGRVGCIDYDKTPCLEETKRQARCFVICQLFIPAECLRAIPSGIQLIHSIFHCVAPAWLSLIQAALPLLYLDHLCYSIYQVGLIMRKEEYVKNLIAQKGESTKAFAESIGLPYTTLLSMLSRGLGGA